MTDPPYHLTSKDKRDHRRASPSEMQREKIGGFMGMKWDGGDIAFRPDVWREVLRVLKPGGHLLAFSGTRTYHRMVCAIEDAGFEIRDQIGWLYGSGFPKSLDVSKAIDKKLGVADQRVITHYKGQGPRSMFDGGKPRPASLPASLWQGWGTALKPAWEPIVLARKPLIGTVAENVLKHGTGGINVDGCRVAGAMGNSQYRSTGNGRKTFIGGGDAGKSYRVENHPAGRWPANVIHDGSPEVLAEFAKFGESKSRFNGGSGYKHAAPKRRAFQGDYRLREVFGHGDTGTAARFFYCAKASKKDRDEGLRAGVAERKTAAMQGNLVNGQRLAGNGTPIKTPMRRNHHPTVKPTALMRYLCKLVTPPNGVVLDPFTGSGSTGKAALLEGFSFIGIERDPEYLKISKARIKAAENVERRTPNVECRIVALRRDKRC